MLNVSSIVRRLAAGLGIFASATVLAVETAPSGQALKSGLISRIDPPCWWTGMTNDTLQLLVSGPGISKAEFSVSYPGVKIDRQFAGDSPNYKFIYLTIGENTRPGKVRLSLNIDGRKSSVEYPLLKRDRNAGEYHGFDASDVLYLIMPDRFARGKFADEKRTARDIAGLKNSSPVDRSNPNGRHGGNIAGINDHLDYLDSLGVTALWVCPVLENDMPGGSYHGYATTDYYRIDPRFGSNAEWKNLIDNAHSKGLKVVMDMIFNHSGSGHPWLKDAPYSDWYNHPSGDTMTNYRLTTVHDPYVSEYDLDHTVNGWFVPEMPDLNQRNPEVMKYLTQNSIWWIESSKIDGIRMDTYPYADMEGMSKWAADVLKEYPDFNIVGECWYASEAGPAFWQKGSRINPKETNLPTVMDFFLAQDKGRKAFYSQTDPWNGLNDLYDHLAQDFLYPDPSHILTFMDNHDTDRFLLAEPKDSKDIDVWKQAAAWLLTSRGIPQLYYGTELLMNGSKEGSDGYVRRDVPGGFPGDTTDNFTAAGRTDLQNEAWDYISRILQFRKGEYNDVIAKGSLKHFMPQNGVYTYRRQLGDRTVTVMMNGKDEPNTVSMANVAEILPAGTVLHDIISGQNVTVTPEMTFAPRQVMILTK